MNAERNIKTIKIKDTVLGAGQVKICVPIVGKDKKGIGEELDIIKNCGCHLVEWRADCFRDWSSKDAVLDVLDYIHESLKNIPVIVTFRSLNEGGNEDISNDSYIEFYKNIIPTKRADIIDIELSKGTMVWETLSKLSGENGVYSICSSHDFKKTPPREELYERFCLMYERGADICKIAVMPGSGADVADLIWASSHFKENHKDTLVISMSMGKLGAVSRIAGSVTGSCLTFASAKQASAPGQLSVDGVKNILDNLCLQD